MAAVNMTAESIAAMQEIAAIMQPVQEHLNTISSLTLKRDEILAKVQPELDALDEEFKPVISALSEFAPEYQKHVDVLGFDPLGFIKEYNRLAGIKTERKRRPEDRKAIVDFLTDNPGSTVDDVVTGSGVDDETYVLGVLNNLKAAKKAVTGGERGKRTFTLVA